MPTPKFHRVGEAMAVDGDAPAAEIAPPDLDLDCYPYGFSPLLLFAQESYFDQGYSNYNSVVQFFAGVLDVNMLENVLYERKNMLYEELLQFVIDNKMLVTCCIEAHFTAFQVLSEKVVIFYDPLKPYLSIISGADQCKRFMTFLMLKCSYGDSQHIQENKNHYTGPDSTNPTRKMIYDLWRGINKMQPENHAGVRKGTVNLNLDRFLLVNDARDPRRMSTQLTGNTCYFQTYIFALLCKAGGIELARDQASVDVLAADKLEAATISVCRLLLEFFVDAPTGVLRPLTNCNVVLDFYRHKDAAYYGYVTHYLKSRGLDVPDYEAQYEQLLRFYRARPKLHTYRRFQLESAMASTLNTKSLQAVCDASVDGVYKLGRAQYYKYRAASLMFGFNTNITQHLDDFCEFNALRKNQLLAFYDELQPHVRECVTARRATNKYRDYYFMAQFEVGQRELVELHHYTYEIDLCALLGKLLSKANSKALAERVGAVNALLAQQIYFSTQRTSDYEKFMTQAQFLGSKRHYDFFLTSFMSPAFFQSFAGLGFTEMNPKEKEINALTRTSFYSCELMSRQSWRMEHEFEKECVNQMARSTLRDHSASFSGQHDLEQKYQIAVRIGTGHTYTKYNTLMHFLNVAEAYWHNPDLNGIQVFGKDIRALLAICCQKIFFEEGHTWYHYGPIEVGASIGYGRVDMDLQVAQCSGGAAAYVSREKRNSRHTVVVTDRVYEYGYLKGILERLFCLAGGVRFKSDDVVLNLAMLSLVLDFGLDGQHAALLNLPFLRSLAALHDGEGGAGGGGGGGGGGVLDKRQLQVEVSNWINEFDKKNTADSVTRLGVEKLLFEASYKFIVNKGMNVRSKAFELIRMLNGDPAYMQYVLMCKVYVSLCQINKSAEVDYYKVRVNNDYRILIPQNFSAATSDYLDATTKRYTFTEVGGFIRYGELPLFDVRASQPEIHLHKVRFDAAGPEVQSMVKYIEFSNVFRSAADEAHYLIFIADNALLVELGADGGVTIRINKIPVEVATVYFTEAMSFVPCFKYADSDDMILFTSRNVHYHIDKAGQFNENYYGMKHELIENILSEQGYVDLNDEVVFKKFKLSELLTESKTVLHFPDYLLQVVSQQQLINLLDLAVYVRNLGLFILALFYLRRSSIDLTYVATDQEAKIKKITGPWKAAIIYVLSKVEAKPTPPHYDELFQKQFFDLNQHEKLPLADFIERLCENFTRYQRFSDGRYQIVPTDKQKRFLRRIITAKECFHFSEVGSGKTKVILPLLCQTFLSNNAEAHEWLARGGEQKSVMVILVPEHLVADARAQVFRYCLNLNFAEEYRVYDDIFALLHDEVQLRPAGGSGYASVPSKRAYSGSSGSSARAPGKQIFITSFNQFKKALTYDKICAKVRPYRERILVVADEVDDFLDRDKLVFNICSNKANAFDKEVLESYFGVCRAVYRGEPRPPDAAAAANPAYWQQLHDKFAAIHVEIQEKSRSINKSFGIFNEQTLRHCATNIAQDIEGYKSLIARPYESVNRAMPGSYYSDVERTIYLTYYILMEDTAKYDELFQQERKFISFEYFSSHVAKAIDYDDLVYGSHSLSALVVKHPETKDGLTRFLYEVILRRMEIRDQSRSVNSIDIVFNFDAIGFTGTPFIDNYPTFEYIRTQREDDIPDMIDRSFYAYASEQLPAEQFEERFARFQGDNSSVVVEYVPSGFMQAATDELDILRHIFARDAAGGSGATQQLERMQVVSPPPPEAMEAAAAAEAGPMDVEVDLRAEAAPAGFNVLVDLCGIFKKASIHQVRDVVLSHFGPDQFHYIYHIDQTDGSDRVLALTNDSDVQFDDEFFKFLCKTYGAALRERVFFFVDNRNVIGKDIPFQLAFQRAFGVPMFYRSAVLAHDVGDFSKVWQAMGRSRTMNATRFSIFTSQLDDGGGGGGGTGMADIKRHPLTRQLYVSNCDRKVAGNLSSAYQTLVSLANLSHDRFYFCDEIVNVFLEKMEMTIDAKLDRHVKGLALHVLGRPLPAGILAHILAAKFGKSATPAVAGAAPPSAELVAALLGHVVRAKFEQRAPSDDVHDALLGFLSGEQEGTMEISYTKQQQKQKQKQHNKDQDADTMEVFDKRHQLTFSDETDNYFAYTLTPQTDLPKLALNLPLPLPIFKLSYALDGKRRTVALYPTLQFLYSHYLRAEYITPQVSEALRSHADPQYVERFVAEAERLAEADRAAPAAAASGAGTSQPQLAVQVLLNHVRQNPQYTLAALREGIYVLGMKDQFNVHDLPQHPLRDHVQYVADEMGFILVDRSPQPASRSVDAFGPYFIEQYLVMEVLSKQEVAQNVLDYYVHHKETLQRGVQTYSEAQGKGFICWRFVNEHRQQPPAAPAAAGALTPA